MGGVTFLCSKERLQDFYATYPDKRNLPQFALVGRSNVGKSSLINHLFGEGLAKTAKKPGKTAMLQFFLTPFGLFIDLPGYGFAKASKQIRAHWDEGARSVLENNPQLHCAFFLLDIRRDPSLEDEEMLVWMQEKKTPFLALFTKTDKLDASKKKLREKTLQNTLNIALFISYSIKDPLGKRELLYRLKHGTFA